MSSSDRQDSLMILSAGCNCGGLADLLLAGSAAENALCPHLLLKVSSMYVRCALSSLGKNPVYKSHLRPGFAGYYLSTLGCLFVRETANITEADTQCYNMGLLFYCCCQGGALQQLKEGSRQAKGVADCSNRWCLIRPTYRFGH